MDTAILLPVFVLVFWTFCVLSLILITRFGAYFQGRVNAEDFKTTESPRVPYAAGIANRNYMNLLELPVLFYTVCLLLCISPQHVPASLHLAWCYVILRIAHSIVHLTYNNVIHRFAFFAASNVILLSLWIMTASHLLTNAAACKDLSRMFPGETGSI